MIERLSIKNYAIIDTLELELAKGFNVFTGETGAGKSIIVGALGLLLGEKGDTTMVRTGEEKAVVEGEFSVGDPAVKQKVKEILFDDPETIIIRREIAQGGKGRIFINGLQEPLAKLEALGEWLVDIHGQHDHQLLLSQKVHLDILDTFGGHSSDREKIKELYLSYQKKNEEMRELEQDEKKLQDEKIYWETAIEDIDEAKLEASEEEELSLSLRKMENAEKIHVSFSEAHDMLYSEEGSVSAKVLKSLNLIREHSPIDKRYEELVEILEDASAKIDESANLIAEYKDELEFDQKTMEDTVDRIELIKDLKRKYKKNSIEELLQYAKDCSDRLAKFANRVEELVKLKSEIAKIKAELIENSLALSKKRQATGAELAKRIKAELSFLGMEKADFITDIKYVKEEAGPFVINNIPVKINETGMDRAEFFISSNPGEEPKPLKKVASGGEISRVMLALKTIFSKSDSIETLIFDEIDVGIGGLTANNVAVKMREIANDRQIVVITHLPQIAARAEHHYVISKNISEGKTFTAVNPITGEKRTEEIARMLGGETQAAMVHAKEMLQSGK